MTVKIDGREIPQEAIDHEFNRLVRFYSEHMSPGQRREQEDILRRKAVEQAIGARCLLTEAHRLDIRPKPEDIEAKLQATINDVGGREKFDEILAKQNLTEDALCSIIAQGCKVDALVEKITSGLSDPTEEEMKQHFDEHRAEYKQPERVQAMHILVKAEPDDKEAREEARNKISAIKKRIRHKDDFAREAEEHSDCPSGQRNGGSLGWFCRGMMIPEFDKAVFSMKTGDIAIVETSFGLHLVLKTAEEKESPGSFEESRENILSLLRHVKRGEVISAYVNDLRNKSVIEES